MLACVSSLNIIFLDAQNLIQITLYIRPSFCRLAQRLSLLAALVSVKNFVFLYIHILYIKCLISMCEKVVDPDLTVDKAHPLQATPVPPVHPLRVTQEHHSKVAVCQH